MLVSGVDHAVSAPVEPHGRAVGASPERLSPSGSLVDAVVGADVFVGVSAPNLLSGDDIAGVAEDASVLALANREPEVDRMAAMLHAAVVATGSRTS